MSKVNIVKFVRDNVNVDSIGRNRAGEYVARVGFFYRHGGSAEKLVAAIKAALPTAVILDSGEVWKSFRGGASVAQGSHWFVRFTVPQS